MVSTFKRIPHILRQKRATQIMTNLMFFDTETKDMLQGKNPFTQKHKLWFGYARAFILNGMEKKRDKTIRFTEIDQFYAFVKSRLQDKKPLYLFAHNIGFDLTIMDFWNQVLKNDIKLEFAVVEDPPTIIKCTWNNCRIILIDTLNFWRTSLAKLGNSIGIKKLPMPKETASIKQWNEYGENDVTILAESVYNLLKFINQYDLGGMGYTAPSLAMNSFKRKFMKHEIFIHDNTKTLKMERAAYYGGRVQCFYIGELPAKKYYYLDVNSLYPSVMRQSFPVKLLGHCHENCDANIRSIVGKCAIVAHCYIDSKNEMFPIRYNNRLCYCVGRYNTFLCGAEFDRALQTNSIRHIYRFAFYEQQPIFGEFVRFFWNLRRKYRAEKNLVYETFCKLLMNSLYGKFGQNGVSWTEFNYDTFKEYLEILKKDEIIDKYDEKALCYEVETYKNWIVKGLENPVKLRSISNKIQIKFPINEHWESFPAIAGFVTAYAREKLLEYITIAGDGHVFYCDTDSLFVDEVGYKNLKKKDCLNDHELGCLKLVDTTKKLIIYGPKDYVFGDRKVMKGIRHDAIQINKNTFQQAQFEGLKTILKRDADPFIEIKQIQKVNHRKFNKGVIKSSGFVTPYVLNQSMESNSTLV